MRERKSEARRTFAALFLIATCSASFLFESVESAAGQEAVPSTPIVGELRLQPQSLTLTGIRRPGSILVSTETADGASIELTGEALFVSADDQVAAVDALGWVHAVRSGQTTITVTAAGKSASLPVTVALPESPRPWSFRHDVMPALSKAGCNQGACHGYSLGKNGFKLSLRGGDENWDYQAIAHEFLGRRINRQRPESSLLVTKPLGDVPHGGGVRFEPGDLVCESLLGWIREGAESDLADPVQLVSIAVHPEAARIQPGSQQQLQVLATYTDGTVRDVTQLGIFSSNAEAVAEVDAAGLVTSQSLGESVIVVRFERMFDVANIVILGDAPGFVAAPVPEDNLVDKHVIGKLNALKITPSDLASDADFLRRLFVDLIGVQPKPDEVRAFLADPAADKRARAVESLFARPEFVDHWSLRWGDLLENSRVSMSEQQMWAFREWIRSCIASNMPLDEFARRLLTAQGSYRDDPASAYFLASSDANDTLERVTQVFCGVRMLCARCHTHPFENWTQADYYGLAGFFNQVTLKQDPTLAADGKARVVLLNRAAGYAVNPRTGGVQPPRFLGSVEPPLTPEGDRREVYARWLTSSENPLFAKSLANRIWSYFFHRGVIEPVDDLRQTNPPVNPALLDALTAEFVSHGHDARHLMRTIVNSQTYQRSGMANASNGRDETNFSRAVPRRLRAEVVLDCLVQATGVPESFPGAPAGFTAAQLPDAEIQSEFLSLFGKPQRAEACECERSDDSNMLQALQFINGAAILQRTSNPGGRVMALLSQHPANETLIGELYLWALARPPRPAEVQAALAHFEAYAEKRAEAAQDLMWALLNSKDFMFNH